MDERAAVPVTEPERPPVVGRVEGLDDARALTILTTEHYSLMTSRSLVYNEAFSRTGMFLTFLSATLVALGFVSQGGMAAQDFLIVAVGLLALDFVIGLATLGRISSASAEEFRALQGMNRIRHAYLEMAPAVAAYFSTSSTDDLPAVLNIYGTPSGELSGLGSVLHGLTTAPGMVGIICSAVGGALVGAVALLLGAEPRVAVFASLVGFVVAFVLIFRNAMGQFEAIERGLEVRFPPESKAPGR